VNDLADNAVDTGSLRYAVNTAAAGDTINFASGLIGTITLTNGPLTINNNVTITGPGVGLLTISGNNTVPVFTIFAAGPVSISGLVIANGASSSTVSGGGISGIYAGIWTVSNCAFYNNTTTAGGGGGAIANGGTLTVENSTFANNSAPDGPGGGPGGAIFNNGGTLTVQNSTFFGNSASGPGAGIFNNGSVTISNSTITGSTGDGIFNNGGSGNTVTLTNSIVTGNTTGDCDQCGTQSVNNLIGGTPHLGPLQFNGGGTETMMPLPGSPVIGAGSGSTLGTDERGFARPTGSGVASDLGAVQTNYLTVTNLNDSGTGSLREAITAANSAGSADIVFQSGLTGTVALSSILPSITGNLDIAGPGANQITISGQGTTSVIDIPNSTPLVNMAGVTINQGNDPVNLTPAVSNSGVLTVVGCAFSDNTGDNGGAILNKRTLGVENATFSNNTATYGGAIDNQGTMMLGNGTFVGNRAYNGNGGGIENTGNALVIDSTITGNESLNGGVGAGMDNTGGALSVTNSILTANMNLGTNTEDDCRNCTQTGPILTGSDPKLGPLAYNGLNATLQTMLPLPASGAIQIGDPTQLIPALTIDARGFPRLTAGKLDLGAAQTDYNSVRFVQQPTNTSFNADISPAVTVEVLETNNNLAGPNNTDAVNGIPITLTLNGTGTLGGTLTQTTAGGLATFGDLSIPTMGTGNTLATAVTVTPAGLTPVQTLTATSQSFDITLVATTVSFNPPLPASVTYGVAPLTLKATTVASGTVTPQTVSFHVDSGSASINGNVLTITGAGSVVVEVDAAANATYAASSATSTITVMQAATQLTLTSSASQAPVGTSVTLTATATSSSGTPTGTVTFLAGSTSLGTATLSPQGVATLAVTTLPIGSNTITATYPGDTNFAASQAQLSGTIVVGTPGFALTSSTSSLSVKSGGTGSVTLTLTPAFGYAGTLNLACGGMPGTSSCTFQPATAQFDGSGNPVTVTVTMNIASANQLSRRTALAQLRPLIPLGGLPVLPAVLLWFPETDDLSDVQFVGAQADPDNPRSRSYRWLRISIFLLFGIGLLGMLFGCGGSSKPSGGQYSVTITATGPGNVNQAISVQLNVT
jgi:predicted outer membrane repeat protein